MQSIRYTIGIGLLMLVGIHTATAEVAYTPGDTWKLEGATDWTNSPHFAGLGTVQSTGNPDATSVWRFMRYDVFKEFYV